MEENIRTEAFYEEENGEEMRIEVTVPRSQMMELCDGEIDDDSDDESNVVTFHNNRMGQNNNATIRSDGLTTEERNSSQHQEVLDKPKGKEVSKKSKTSLSDSDREEIRSLHQRIADLQDILTNSGLKGKTDRNPEKSKRKYNTQSDRDWQRRNQAGKDGEGDKIDKIGNSESGTTIYQPAIVHFENDQGQDFIDTAPKGNDNLRISSSSEEIGVNTSDEFENGDFNEADEFLAISESRAMAMNRNYTRPDFDGQMPSSSRQGGGDREAGCGNSIPQFHMSRSQMNRQPGAVQMPTRQGNQSRYRTTPEDKADQLIRDSEQAKARIYDLQGKEPVHSTTSIDDDYLLVAAHVDEVIQRKIANHEYVEFAKLLPKDKVTTESDNRMEMVNRGGLSYWVPVSDRESSSIHGFGKWEQAFRVFMNIYLRFHPQRAAELIEYNHSIFHASQSYAWDNVAAYDVDFRLHMARHANRSWALILQQAWLFRLKDKFRQDHYNSTNNRNFHSQDRRSNHSGNKKDTCHRFNKGKCTYGLKCRFEHRCNTCNKWGHGAHICRKGNGNGNNHGNAAQIEVKEEKKN